MLLTELKNELGIIFQLEQRWVDEVYTTKDRERNIEELFRVYKQYKEVILSMIESISEITKDSEKIEQHKKNLIGARQQIAAIKLSKTETVMPEQNGGSLWLADLCSDDLNRSSNAKQRLLPVTTVSDADIERLEKTLPSPSKADRYLFKKEAASAQASVIDRAPSRFHSRMDTPELSSDEMNNPVPRSSNRKRVNDSASLPSAPLESEPPYKRAREDSVLELKQYLKPNEHARWNRLYGKRKTAAQQAEWRKLANMLSARKARDVKNSSHERLTAQCKELKQELTSLGKKYDALAAENLALKAQLERINRQNLASETHLSQATGLRSHSIFASSVLEAASAPTNNGSDLDVWLDQHRR